MWLIWTASSEFGTYRLCEQRRFRRACAVSPEPLLPVHTSSESKGTFRQKARSLAPLNGWACAVKICHDGMLEDTNSLDAAHIIHVYVRMQTIFNILFLNVQWQVSVQLQYSKFDIFSCSMKTVPSEDKIKYFLHLPHPCILSFFFWWEVRFKMQNSSLNKACSSVFSTLPLSFLRKTKQTDACLFLSRKHLKLTHQCMMYM